MSRNIPDPREEEGADRRRADMAACLRRAYDTETDEPQVPAAFREIISRLAAADRHG